ncbi:MAG: hypothetical protein AAGJ19_08780 [Myxococcota bacterium]
MKGITLRFFPPVRRRSSCFDAATMWVWSMAGYGADKRQKERQRAEKKADKESRRKARKAEKAEATVPEGVDPDIAGIVPGPQPKPEDVE